MEIKSIANEAIMESPLYMPIAIRRLTRMGSLQDMTVRGLAPHALDGPFHAGTINDAQHAVRTLANAHAHGDLSGVAFGQHHDHYAHWVPPLHGLDVNAWQPPTQYRVYLQPIQVEFPLTISHIGFAIQADTQAGNCRVGLYEDNGLTPAGGALVCQSVNVATISYKNELAVTAEAGMSLSLTPALYWGVVSTDNTTNRIARQHANFMGGTRPWPEHYDLGALGPFTDPCPALIDDVNVPFTWLVVSSVP